MKQGRASSSGPGSRKIEPRSTAVNPGAVAQLGAHVGVRRAVEVMDSGRGYKAPPIRSGVLKCGTQGRHK